MQKYPSRRIMAPWALYLQASIKILELVIDRVFILFQ